MRKMMMLCSLLSALALAGCGVLVNRSAECRDETPHINAHNFFWVLVPTPPPPSTKAQFLESWGKPDQVIGVSQESETWLYQRKLWCGAVPVALLPLPLLLPVCDGFDRITFKGELGQRLHSKHTVTRGYIFPSGRTDDPPCRYPLPFAPAHLEDDVPAVSGRVVLYTPAPPEIPYHSVEIDGVYVASLRGSSHYPFLTAPGTREFVIANAKDPVALTVTVLPGRTFYIKVDRSEKGKPYLALVAPEAAKNEMRESTLLTLP